MNGEIFAQGLVSSPTFYPFLQQLTAIQSHEWINKSFYHYDTSILLPQVRGLVPSKYNRPCVMMSSYSWIYYSTDSSCSG